MSKVRNIFFKKNSTNDCQEILNISKNLYKFAMNGFKVSKLETMYYKNYCIYPSYTKNSLEIIAEKTIFKYDKFDHLNKPSDLFINLPKITKLNIPVKIQNNKYIELFDAIINKETYMIPPYYVYADSNEENTPIKLEIPQEYKDKLLFKEKGEEFILSTVSVNADNEMNEFICKLTVDPLLLGLK